jgi:hypothetical protein
MPPIRISGGGASSGDDLLVSVASVSKGSYLDLRYSAGPKFWTSGIGTLELDHLTIADFATDCATFLLTTGTKLLVHHASFFSAVAEGSGCNTAIQMGGGGTYPLTGAITDPFSGYGSVIDTVDFLRMGIVLDMVGNVNDTKFLNSYVIGGNTSTTPPIIRAANAQSAAYNNRSNTIRGNTLEGCAPINGAGSCTYSYSCGIKLSNSTNWNIGDNGWYDALGPFLCGDSTAIHNNIEKTNYVDFSGTALTDSTWSANNYMPWRTIPFTFDGGGSALSGTTTRCTLVPFGGYINQFSAQGDQAGSVTITVKAVALASYTGPSSASDISNGGESMSSVAKLTDSTLTSWARTLAPQTMVCVTLSSPSTFTWITGSVQVWEGR